VLPFQPLDEAQVMAPAVGDDLLALDEALAQLAARDSEAAELVKLRFFAGLTSAQAAEALGISPRTADRVWTYARTFLLAALQKSRDCRGMELVDKTWKPEAEAKEGPSLAVQASGFHPRSVGRTRFLPNLAAGLSSPARRAGGR
jgi:hypothetical protein